MKANLKIIGHELGAALAVIATFALIFVYQPVNPLVAKGSVFSVSNFSYCGAGLSDEQTTHGPCHACRSNAIVLPAPPDDASPAYTRFATILFDLVNEGIINGVFATHYYARAPPIVV